MAQNSRDPGSVFFPGRRFVKDTYNKSQDWQSDETRVLQRGIVIDVLESNDTLGTEPFSPPYSIKAKIFNQDISEGTSDPASEEDFWYPPFLPIHTLSLPMKGEEVWIIKEVTAKSSIGYWVCRVNDSTPLNRVDAKSYLISRIDFFKQQGMNLNINALRHSSEPTSDNVYPLPARPGDVIQQGRSDTFIRHTYHVNTKEGVLELGIKERRRYSLGDAISLGNLHTKTLHAADADLNDITKRGVESGPEPSNNDIIANTADVLINISNLSDSETKLFREVLGEKLESKFSEIINIVNDLSNGLSTTINWVNGHSHGTETKKHKINLVFLTADGDPYVKTIAFNTGGSQTSRLNGEAINSTKSKLHAIGQRLASLKNTIKEILSKHHYIN
jgi:hypothetical protein